MTDFKLVGPALAVTEESSVSGNTPVARLKVPSPMEVSAAIAVGPRRFRVAGENRPRRFALLVAGFALLHSIRRICGVLESYCSINGSSAALRCPRSPHRKWCFNCKRSGASASLRRV